jgi:hypothetical protein
MKVLLLATAAVFASPALAEGLTVSPYTAELDPLTLTLGGEAHGAVFSPSLPKAGGADQRWASGAADLDLKLQRDYDSGLSLSLRSSFEVLRDRLSYDNYGGNLVQKVYGVAQTGLGSLELGMTDGAAYVLSVTGPVVDSYVSLENPNTSFYVDPATGRPFIEAFTLQTGLNSSSNYAKFSYYTPRLMGLQLGVSYTPSEGREVVPFLSNGPHAPNRQKSIWETALSYSETFEDFSIGAYGAAAFGHGDGKGASDAGLTDWGFGAEVDVPFGEEWKLAFGGAYRRTNTYVFDVYQATSDAASEGTHLSTTLSWNDFKLGAEYANGTAKGDVGDPVLGLRGVGVTAGYQISDNLAASLGWQELHYSRNTGAFYDGSKKIGMNAVFLHLTFKVPGSAN